MDDMPHSKPIDPESVIACNPSSFSMPDAMLFDIVIECSSHDGADLTMEEMQMIVVDTREDVSDPHPLNRTSSTLWKYQGVIELHRDVDHLVIIIRSEEAGEFGFLDLTRDIPHFLGNTATVGVDVHKRKITMDEGFPTLWVQFAVSSVGQEHDQQQHISAQVLNFDDLMESIAPLNAGQAVSSGIAYFNAGTTSLNRFQNTGSMSDISEAIENLQLAVHLTPEAHENMPRSLTHLGVSFQDRFKRTGDQADLVSAIKYTQKAVLLAPNCHESTPGSLTNLGNMFLYRYEQTGDQLDLNSAIEHHQKAVDLSPKSHPDTPTLMCNLNNSILRRFEQTGNLADISIAIENYRAAIRLTPENDPKVPLQLFSLGNLFTTRFTQIGDIDDLSSAIEHHQKSVILTPEDHPALPQRLSNLGNSFSRLFEQTSDLANLSSSIDYHQMAVELTPKGHSDMPTLLNNLGNSFLTRFGQTRDSSDMSHAMEHHQKAVRIASKRYPNPDMPPLLINLGTSFLTHFEQTGDLGDISAAIEHQQMAVKLTSEHHLDLPSRLISLGNSFSLRFGRTGDFADLSSAIGHHQKAAELTSHSHPSMPSILSSLGNSFTQRFERTKDLVDITTAIELHQRTVHLTPESHADIGSRLSNLGRSLKARFGLSGDLTDMSSAIEHLQKAVDLTPESHAHMSSWLTNLGSLYAIRFYQTRDLADISNAIENIRKAILLTPEGEAGIAHRASNLGTSYFRRYEQTKEAGDCRAAALYYRLAAMQKSGAPTTRLHAARGWAICCGKLGNEAETQRAFGVAIELLPLVASLDRTIQNRHTSLLDLSDLTREAVALSAVVENNDLALEWLEQGRCLVWTQLNQLRTPADLLRRHDAQLADRFVTVSRALETSGSRAESSGWSTGTSIAQQISAEGQARSHLKLAQEWEHILADIRALPNFDDFLRPPKSTKLLSQIPVDGLVVVINVHEFRCDALALIHGADEPLHISLDDFSYEKAVLLRNQLGYHLTSEKLRMRDSDERGGRLARRPDQGLHHILRVLWFCVVWPVLQGLGYSSPPAHRDRIWWCTTGPLTSLPIHAAGIYNPDNKTPGPCLSDFAVSSYIPTVTTLLEKLRNSANLTHQDTKLLLLSQPNALPHAPIPGTVTETRTVLKRIQEDGLEAVLVEDEEGTKSRVIEEMASHSWVHIASHASQHPTEPLKSGFYLHDGQLELLEIIRQRLPSANFAYLSACQTSVGNEKLSEEAVHLAAGMLAAGYQGVVATMWSIKDQYAPQIAEDFYEHLLREKRESGVQQLSSRRAAYALDEATRKIREKLGDSEYALLTWVPYIHHGL